MTFVAIDALNAKLQLAIHVKYIRLTTADYLLSKVNVESVHLITAEYLILAVHVNSVQ